MSFCEASEDGLKGDSLLVIVPSYPNQDRSYWGGSFVWNQIAELKDSFKKVIVIAPVLRSFGCMRKDKLCKDYAYDNVEVYYPRAAYVPLFWTNRLLVDNRLDVVNRTIERYHLDFDLIHAHFTWPSGYIGVKLKERYNTPLVTTIHEDGEWLSREIALNHPLINAAWSGADLLIRVNRKDAAALRQFNDRVCSIPNGYSPNFYPIDTLVARRKLGLAEDTPIVFSLGYLIKRKGFNFLIDAMERISGSRDDVLCYIGGDGTERKNLQNQIDRLDLGERVTLLGTVSEEDLPLWMNAANLFVLPSLNEGNPTVMFEVLGCGKPFVGTKVGGVPEVISSDEYGMLVEPADAAELAEKILLSLDREWDRDSIRRYSIRYTWKSIADEIIKAYRQVHGESG